MDDLLRRDLMRGVGKLRVEEPKLNPCTGCHEMALSLAQGERRT